MSEPTKDAPSVPEKALSAAYAVLRAELDTQPAPSPDALSAMYKRLRADLAGAALALPFEIKGAWGSEHAARRLAAVLILLEQVVRDRRTLPLAAPPEGWS